MPLTQSQEKKQGVTSPTNLPEDDEASSNDQSSDHSDDEAPFAGAVPPGVVLDEENSEDRSQDGENHVEDSFIIEDDALEAVELPAEFSMDNHQDLSHHFKGNYYMRHSLRSLICLLVICQFYVHMATMKPKRRPAFVSKSQKG